MFRTNLEDGREAPSKASKLYFQDFRSSLQSHPLWVTLYQFKEFHRECLKYKHDKIR